MIFSFVQFIVSSLSCTQLVSLLVSLFGVLSFIGDRVEFLSSKAHLSCVPPSIVSRVSTTKRSGLAQSTRRFVNRSSPDRGRRRLQSMPEWGLAYLWRWPGEKTQGESIKCFFSPQEYLSNKLNHIDFKSKDQRS